MLISAAASFENPAGPGRCEDPRGFRHPVCQVTRPLARAMLACLSSMRGHVSVRGVLVAASLALGSLAFAQAPQPPAALPAPLPLFPADNWWNVDISARACRLAQHQLHQLHRGPAARSTPTSGETSARSRTSTGWSTRSCRGRTPLEVVDFDAYGYPDESDVGAPGRPPGYPIPVGARTQPKWIEGGQAGRVQRQRLPHAARRPGQPDALRALPGVLERQPSGRPARARSSRSTATCAGPTAGRAPTPRASPSCPASCATTRSSGPTPSATRSG